jgi:hypothetical protein
MCDYSLHAVASRPARVGDKLMTSAFANSSTRGFAAAGEPGVAVCLHPGTELVFEQEVQRDHCFTRLMPSLRFGRITERLARFRHVNEDRPHTHHDALEFSNGQIVLITRLSSGQRATVLQLPASPRGDNETKGQAAEPALDAAFG